MTIDSFRPDTVYTIYIAATPDRVWQALTSAEFSRAYFFGFAVEMEPPLRCWRRSGNSESRRPECSHAKGPGNPGPFDTLQSVFTLQSVVADA